MYVLRIEVIREAIAVLKPLYIHETFPAYLHLRRQAAILQRWTDLQPDYWGEPASWLSVPGGPPGKPNFRPFTSRGDADMSYWMAHNLAGSYQQSSLRGLKDLYVDSSGDWRLPTLANGDPDAEQVSRRLLKERPIPAWAVAAFLYRNRSFVDDGPVFPDDDTGWPEGWPDVFEIFQQQFQWTSNEAHILFSWSSPESEPFEEWRSEDAESFLG